MIKMVVTIDGQSFEVELEPSSLCRSELCVKVDGEAVEVLIPDLPSEPEGLEWLVVDEHPYQIDFDRDLHWIKDYSGSHSVAIQNVTTVTNPRRIGNGNIQAPIAGQISQVLVSPGQAVEMGQAVLILEAMKMQNEIRAPRTGIVAAVQVSPGKIVSRGEPLIEIKVEED